MKYYEKPDISKGINVNKTSASKESDICYYWYFSDKGFMFQQNKCNGFHDVQMMFIKLSDTAILSINGAGQDCIVNVISKSEAVDLPQKADLNENSGTL